MVKERYHKTTSHRKSQVDGSKMELSEDNRRSRVTEYWVLRRRGTKTRLPKELYINNLKK